jgi:serine/threonine protein kinase
MHKTHFSNDYTTDKKMASGSTASIYLAHHKKKKKKVAVKVFSKYKVHQN